MIRNFADVVLIFFNNFSGMELFISNEKSMVLFLESLFRGVN